ncbi:MAG: hypothetical protein AB7L65_05225 [Hyphomonadaceae bacterium]
MAWALITPFARIGARAYCMATLALSALALAASFALGQGGAMHWLAAAATLAPGAPFFIGCRFASVQTLTCGLWGPPLSPLLWAGLFWCAFCLSASRLRAAGVCVWRLVGLYALLFAAQAGAAAALSYASAAALLPAPQIGRIGFALTLLYWLAHVLLRVWPARAGRSA